MILAVGFAAPFPFIKSAVAGDNIKWISLNACRWNFSLEQFKQLKAIGVQAIEEELTWAEIENTEGQFNFSAFDDCYSKIKQAGLEWIPQIAVQYPPQWVYAKDTNFYYICRDGSKASQYPSPPNFLDPNSYVYVDKFINAVTVHYKNADIPFIYIATGANGESFYPWCEINGSSEHAAFDENTISEWRKFTGHANAYPWSNSGKCDFGDCGSDYNTFIDWWNSKIDDYIKHTHQLVSQALPNTKLALKIQAERVDHLAGIAKPYNLGAISFGGPLSIGDGGVSDAANKYGVKAWVESFLRPYDVANSCGRNNSETVDDTRYRIDSCYNLDGLVYAIGYDLYTHPDVPYRAASYVSTPTQEFYRLAQLINPNTTCYNRLLGGDGGFEATAGNYVNNTPVYTGYDSWGPAHDCCSDGSGTVSSRSAGEYWNYNDYYKIPEGFSVLELTGSNACACANRAVESSASEYFLEFDYRHVTGPSAPRFCLWDNGCGKCLASNDLSLSDKWQHYGTMVKTEPCTKNLQLHLYSGDNGLAESKNQYDNVVYLPSNACPFAAEMTTCMPKTCGQAGYTCGSIDDGCGKALSCGSCTTGQACSNGKCVSNCTSHSAKKCDSGKLYWYNSCNTKEELAQDCGGDTANSSYRCSGDWIQSETIKKGCSNNVCASESIWVNNADCAASGKICSAGVCAAKSTNTTSAANSPITDNSSNSSAVENNSSNSPTSAPVINRPAAKMTRAEILAKINGIMALIAKLQEQLKAMTGSSAPAANQSGTFSCTQITKNIFYGTQNDPQVKCLQEVLKSQGYSVTVSGNYDAVTKAAVAQFQEKYASEILAPYHLTRGSGNVGNATMAKINSSIIQK